MNIFESYLRNPCLSPDGKDFSPMFSLDHFNLALKIWFLNIFLLHFKFCVN